MSVWLISVGLSLFNICVSGIICFIYEFVFFILSDLFGWLFVVFLKF